MSTRQAFQKLLLAAIAEKKFNATEVAHELSCGFDSAMGHIKGQRQIPYADRDAIMDRLVEIDALLNKWADRDEWASREDDTDAA